MGNNFFLCYSYFNSRPHKEVDYLVELVFSRLTRFQLTTSQGGRQLFRVISSWFFYFNSRPHKEVDNARTNVCDYMSISTHDLTRRSTQTGDFKIKKGIISTHDLTRRSTSPLAGKSTWVRFQLTTSQGGRQQF